MVLKPHERQLLEQMGGSVIAADRDGRITYVTSDAAEALGWSPDELVGKPLTTFIPERMVTRHAEGFARYLETGRSRLLGKAVEVAALRADGTETPIRLSIRMFKRPDGSDLILARLLDEDDDHGLATVRLDRAFERQAYRSI